MLHVRVVEARDLAAADPNGYSDPYCKIKIGDKKEKSATIDKSLSPVWNWDVSFRVRDWSAPLSIEVVDEDDTSANDFLGLVRIKLADVLHQGVCGGWYRLRDKKAEQVTHGRVFVVFAVDRTWVEGKSKERSGHERASILYHATMRVLRQVEEADAQAYQPHNTDPAAAAATAMGAMSFAPSPAVAPASASSSPGSSPSAAEAQSPHISLFVGSWNVGNAVPDEDLSSWLVPGHDVYSIGVQECKYDAPSGSSSGGASGDVGCGVGAALGSTLLNLASDACGAHFQSLLQRNLGPEYELVSESSMMELRNFLFARRTLAPRFHRLRRACEATGIAGLVGNKGGVAISCSLDDASFCFLTCHLAAHQDRTERRNQDVKEIVSNLKLNRRNLDVTHSFRYIFWGGDLNYRLDYGDQGKEHSPTPEQFEAVLSLLRQGEAGRAILASTDQLGAARIRHEVFLHEDGWEEGPITGVEPTFKVERRAGTMFKAQRSPAWCDRVLWRVGLLPLGNGAGADAVASVAPSSPAAVAAAAERARFAVKQLAFGSSPSVSSSDHKPVYALFRVPIVRLPLATDFLRGPLSIRFGSITLRRLGCSTPASGSAGAVSPSDASAQQHEEEQQHHNASVKFYAPYLLHQTQVETSCRVSADEAEEAGGAHQWTREQIPLLRSQVNNVERLRSAPLTIKVLGYAYESSIERLIAAGQIDLAAGAEGRPVSFCAPLTMGGLAAGQVSGTFQLEWAQHGSFTPLTLDQMQAL